MRTTNHRCESSLKSYDTENTIGQKRAISNILSNYSRSSSSTATSTSSSKILPNDEVSTTTCTTTSSMETYEEVVPAGLDLPNNNRSIVLSGNFSNCTIKF